MASFASLWDKVGSKRLVENDDSKAVLAIKHGQNIRDDFWDDFIRLTNNPEALSELLGVSSQDIALWPIKIKEQLDKLENDVEDVKTKVLDTGKLNSDEEL